MEFRRIFGQIFGTESVIAAVVFGMVIAVMAAAAVVSWRKRRRGEAPARREHWHLLEGAYGLALVGMAVFLVVSSFSANARENADPKPALTVKVLAYQWCWQFSYPGHRVTMRGACETGRYPTLALPTSEPVRIEVTSADVLHAFWVPHLDYKLDAFPGHVNTFTVDVRHPGRWIGRCAQYCGLYHYEMDFYLQAMPPAQFGRWLQVHGGVATAAEAAARTAGAASAPSPARAAQPAGVSGR
jgi:cytochrome c oxidase subunit 2